MSKRLNKRQQRLAQEEQDFAASPAPGPPPAGSSRSDDDAAGDEPSAAANVFAALNDGRQDDDEEMDDDSEPEHAQEAAVKKKSKKKKKKSKAGAVAPSDPSTPQPAASASSSTPAGKKKGKGGAAAVKEDDGMDEVDRAIAELKLKFPGLDEERLARTQETGVDVKAGGGLALGLRNLLVIDTRNLDPDAELRKFFGSKVIASAPSSSKRLIKTHLSKPRPTWPKAAMLGLGMRELTPDEVEEKRRRDGRTGGDGAERWFTLVHGGEYREAQRQFLGAVSSHDPNQLSALLQVYPYHTDTVLQMSEVYRQQSDLGQASEYIDRALFAFERAFVPAFNVSLGTGRLDFGRVENRGFFLALTRDLQFLGRRGCWNTSFHFAKLLLSIDPYSDPQAALLHLDFLALKSGHSQWVLDLTSTFDAAIADMGPGGGRVGVLPGWKWTRALAVRNLEGDGEKANEALKAAVIGAPWVIPWLMDKAGLSLPDVFRTHPLFELKIGYDGPESTLHLLSHIHVVRCLPLYKEASVLSWLAKTIPTFLPVVDSTPSSERKAALAFFKGGTPENIVRHVMVSEDNSTLLGFLERKWGQAMGMSFDPLPPINSVSAYDNDYFMNVVRRRRGGDRSGGRQEDEGEDAGLMQAIIDSLMSMTGGAGGDEAAQGAGGGMMAGLAGRLRAMLGGGAGGEQEMDNDERQAMVAQLMEIAEEARARGDPMPGGFPEDDDDDQYTDDEDHSD